MLLMMYMHSALKTQLIQNEQQDVQVKINYFITARLLAEYI